jgi:6-pyruvoyltetrahydropterin/6-carboxytetrahydropterin synthase
MKYELSQKFYFEAAHTLHRAIDAEGSRRIHGHTYHCEITLQGIPNSTSGMLIDLAFVRKEIERVRDMLDHRFLDEVKGLSPATLENLCAFLFRELRDTMPLLIRVSIERPASGDRCSLSS